MYRNAFSMYFLRFMVNYMLLCMLIAREDYFCRNRESIDKLLCTIRDAEQRF